LKVAEVVSLAVRLEVAVPAAPAVPVAL